MGQHYVCRSLLNNESFINGVVSHLVEKLAQTDKQVMLTDKKPGGKDHQQVTRITQLLEGLSVLCTCKGKPLKTNQRKLVSLESAILTGVKQ